VRLLVQFETGVRKSGSQQYQPSWDEDQTIDRRVPEGNLGKGSEAFQTQNLGGKFEYAHEGHKQTKSVPARSKGGRIDVAAPPLDTDVDQNHDDGENEPFNGTNGADKSVGDNVRHFQCSPTDFVLAVGGDPIVEIELSGHQLGCQGGSNVQDVTDPFRQGSGQNQDADSNVETNPFGSSLAQNPREMNDREHQKEPGNNVHDSRRKVQGAVHDTESPFYLNVTGVKTGVF